ncbi:MAG: DUF2313 domain-containing protein [Roseomonas sp.]|nr:DUF2313 domain-containing protein [Roseomonas sp.]
MDASAYLSQLLALLPPGDALPREPGSRLERLLTVPAAELARVDGRVEALLVESDAARTTEMLTDWERALGLPDECYPNEKFSRASKAWYFDGAGVLREAAVDEPRYLFDAAGQRTEAVLVEAAATNFLPNSRVEGAVVGTPGAAPSGWVFSQNTSSLNFSVVGSGSVAGLPYVDVRISGNNTNNASPLIQFHTSLIGTVLTEEWTNSIFIQKITGSGISYAECSLAEFTAAPAYLGQSGQSLDMTPAATNLVRLAHRRVMSLAGVQNLAAFVFFFPSAPVVDATFRIAVPQLERGPVPTSPILNPVGAPAATTRAADNRFVATIQERRARVVARLIERFEPTPAAIIGLAARLGDTVTLKEFTPHDCEDACEAPLLDEPWAHAFQVAGGAQLVVEFTCEDGCETPLSQWRTGAYECAIRRFAPAHTVPIFTYA